MRRPRRLLFAVVALGLLTMPVTYTGGAELPHPHVFFQVWIDVAHGSFDHHHDYHHAVAAEHGPGAPASAAVADAGASDGPSLTDPTAPDTRQLTLVGLACGAVAGVAGRLRRKASDFFAPNGLARGPEPPPPRIATIPA